MLFITAPVTRRTGVISVRILYSVLTESPGITAAQTFVTVNKSDSVGDCFASFTSTPSFAHYLVVATNVIPFCRTIPSIRVPAPALVVAEMLVPVQVAGWPVVREATASGYGALRCA
jgi:hypothetical protein